ncbi:MAG: TIGR04255 family protein [Xanthomonadales bacterium]|nr:TIGR04255 family protein [Xanthomonadales bacterium]
MTEYSSLGHMPRAPLVYTLAMVEYGRIPMMEEYAPQIMEELRTDYPDINEFEIRALKINLNTESGKASAEEEIKKQWRLNSSDGDFGVVFGEDRVVFQTATYEHFPKFAERISVILNVIAQFAKISHTQNIGIRYIDNIYPIDGIQLPELIGPGYLNPEFNLDLQPLTSRVEYVYASTIGELYVRCYSLRNHPGVPQDILPLVEQLSSAQALTMPVSKPFILVDTDHVYMPRNLEDFDLDAVVEKLDGLHQQSSLAFRILATPKALNAWRKKDE